MRKLFTLILLAVGISSALAQHDAIRISHDGINDYAMLSSIESIYFSDDATTMFVMPKDATEPLSMACSTISSIRYVAATEVPARIEVAYNGSSATIDNPYWLTGVSAVADGAYVTITNTNTAVELTTELKGSTDDGGFTYYGEYKTTIMLSGVEIHSQRGSAIDIQCGKRIDLLLKKETVNTLVDMANGEQKAALYCKGHLEIDKSGTLNVTGRSAHAISSKEYLKLKKSDGVINVLGAVKDGIHCKQYFLGNGFTVNITNVGDDGIQTELDGEPNDDGIADGTIIINDGKYTITNSTNGYSEGTETYTAKGLNADGDMMLNGGNINITMTGMGGKGIRVEGMYTQGVEGGEGPELTVVTTGSAYSTGSSTGGGGNRPGGGPGGRPGGNEASGSDAKAIKVMGQIMIYGGTTCVTTEKNGAEGLESKTGIKILGGNHYFKCYDDCINSAGIIEFAGGNTVCYTFGNDAVDSNYGRTGAITISGGNVFAYTTKSSPEEGLDCDNNSYITITGGIAVSAGGSQGGGGGWWGGSGSSSVGSSTQGYYLGSSPSSYSSANYYTLCNTQGEAVCTFKFEANVSNSLSLLTAPNLGKGSITIKQGTSAPTEAYSQVSNASGAGVFFIAPTVTTTSTTATLTSK